MYGGAEEGYEVYMFPVPEEEEAPENDTQQKIRSPLTKDRFVLYCLLGGALLPRAPPCTHRE